MFGRWKVGKIINFDIFLDWKGWSIKIRRSFEFSIQFYLYWTFLIYLKISKFTCRFNLTCWNVPFSTKFSYNLEIVNLKVRLLWKVKQNFVGNEPNRVHKIWHSSQIIRWSLIQPCKFWIKFRTSKLYCCSNPVNFNPAGNFW